MPHSPTANPPNTGMSSPTVPADSQRASGERVGQMPVQMSAPTNLRNFSTTDVDHLAIEEQRGANCARIRELMSTKRASWPTDEEREAAIASAAGEVQFYMARYWQTNCFSDRGAADGARLRMEALIRGRSAAQVARMERERGLDKPACANDGGTRLA